VKLGLREVGEIELEIPDKGELPEHDRYDVILVEDHYAESLQTEGLEHLLASRRILLGEVSETPLVAAYDTILPKPFLPEEIRSAVLGEDDEEEPSLVRESLENFVAKSEETQEGTEILDEEEIRRIRRLLEGEMEEEMERGPMTPPQEALHQKKALHQASYDVEEFMELLEKCKIKKLKRLLRGGRIHITIEFPEERR
jgi:hypothetical protein